MTESGSQQIQSGPPSCAPATCYAEWRDRNKPRLDAMVKHYWKLHSEMNRLNEDISELRHVFGNGASGGTAWTLHNAPHELPPTKKL